MLKEQLVAAVIKEFNLRHEKYAGLLTASLDDNRIVLSFNGITGVLETVYDDTFADLTAEDMFWLNATNAFSELIEIFERQEEL